MRGSSSLPQNAKKFFTTIKCEEVLHYHKIRGSSSLAEEIVLQKKNSLCPIVLISQVVKSGPVSSFSRTVNPMVMLYVWRYSILCVYVSICVVVVAECCSISKKGHRG